MFTDLNNNYYSE